MNRMRVPFNRSTLRWPEIRAVEAVLQQGSVITDGPAVEEFESALCAWSGARYAVAVCHGTCALRLVLAWVDETGTRCCDAVALHPAPYVGVEAALPGGTAPIRPDPYAAMDAFCWVVGSCFGEACEADVERARDTRVPVVLDAARALGNPRVRRLLAAGEVDAVTLSFHPLKTITTGEGGAVLTDNEDAYWWMRDVRANLVSPGLGIAPLRMTEMQAALGRAQMSRMDEFLERRRAIASRYAAALESFASVRGGDGDDGAWNVAPLYVSSFGEVGRVCSALREQGIDARMPRPCWHDRIYNYVMLPIFPAMTNQEVDAVIEAVHNVMKKGGGKC